jgi:outer membrane protein assembly factor BamB
MFRGNAQLTGVATGTLPDSLVLVWSFQAEDKSESIQSSAAIVDGVAFVGTIGGWLYAINLDDGKPRWKFSTLEKPADSAAGEGGEKPDAATAPGELAPAIKSSPTVVGGRVYFGDEVGVFHCLDAATGKRLWKFQTETGGEIVSSANVVGDRVLFASTDANLYCLAVADGKEVWRFKTPTGGLETTPAVADGKTFLSGCDSVLHIVDIAEGQEVGSVEIGSQTRGSPAVVADRLFLAHIGSQVLGIDWKKPEIAWQYTHPEVQFEYHSSAAATSELVIIGGRDKMVHALDRQTGEQRWTFVTKGRVDSSPVVVGRRVFVGSADGNVYGMDIESGKELWRFATGAPISASPAVAAGRLVIGNEDGKLCCFGEEK